MKRPSQEDINFWVQLAQRNLKKRFKLQNEGFHEREGIPKQSVLGGFASNYTFIARAIFLNNAPIDEVRENYITAAQYIIKAFKMAFDESDPEYLGENSDWGALMETSVIEGFNYALIGGNFELGRELSRWFFDPLDNEPMEPDVNRYAHALKHALTGEKEEGKALVKLTLDEYQANPTKDPADINYFTMSMALYGILNNEEAIFNEGLQLHLDFYKTVAKGEIRGTDEAYICENAVALANLAIGFEMKVTIEDPHLPSGLLLI